MNNYVQTKDMWKKLKRKRTLRSNFLNCNEMSTTMCHFAGVLRFDNFSESFPFPIV